MICDCTQLQCVNWYSDLCGHQTGKQKYVRLLPVAMLENDKVECIKLEENRGCSLICTGLVGQGTSVSLCIACKRTIYVYELNKTKQRCRRMKEVTCPGLVQYIVICNERLCVGYPSSFAIYSIQGDGAPVGKLWFCNCYSLHPCILYYLCTRFKYW